MIRSDPTVTSDDPHSSREGRRSNLLLLLVDFNLTLLLLLLFPSLIVSFSLISPKRDGEDARDNNNEGLVRTGGGWE